MSNLKIWLYNEAEEQFLYDTLKPEHIVLEWGSGGSTIEIAKRVKEVYSIEHNLEWFKNVLTEAPGNVNLFYCARNAEELPGNDGTYDGYREYINYPKRFNISFDVVYIDGRARPYCAKVAIGLLNPGGVILMHDYKNPDPRPGYRRYEYEWVEEFLDIIDFEHSLYKFKPNGLLA
jgi:predicted O-methyltransferase YrrM